MDEKKVFENLYRFTSYIPPINLTFNQYLLLGEEPILFHTGSHAQAVELAPKIKNLLDSKVLAYIFVSHFESDECGGLEFLLQHFPEAKVICSEITARQLTGFGFNYNLVVKKPGETLETKGGSLTFVSYPSEMHLWEGLLAVETKSQIIFSSDLFIRMGQITEGIVASSWENEIHRIAPIQVPSSEALEVLRQTLKGLPIKYIAPGHGPVLQMK
jgi:flavorubredoxin